jgi:predicted transcriptional regulator
MAQIGKQNVTITLSTQVVRKARILAAKRSTSISGMLAQQIEALVNEEEAQETAAKSAIARIERGLHLGGMRPVSRAELHDR